MKLYLDGNAFAIVEDDFINLQESDVLDWIPVNKVVGLEHIPYRQIHAAPAMLKELENCMQDFNNLAMQFPPDSDSREIAGNCASRIAELVKKARGE